MPPSGKRDPQGCESSSRLVPPAVPPHPSTRSLFKHLLLLILFFQLIKYFQSSICAYQDSRNLASSHPKLGDGKKSQDLHHCAIHRPQGPQPIYLLSICWFYYILCPGMLAAMSRESGMHSSVRTCF